MPVSNLPFNGIQPARLSSGDVAMCLFDGGPPWRKFLPWTLDVLEAGDRVVCLSDEPLADRLALAEEAKPLQRHRDGGRLVLRGSSQVLLRNGQFDAGWALEQVRLLAVDPSLQGKRVALLFIGMPTALATFPDEAVLEDFVSRLEALARERQLAAVCLYNRNEFPASFLFGVLERHSKIVLDGTLLENLYYLPPPIDDPAAGEPALARRLDHVRQANRDRDAVTTERNLLRALIDNLPASVFVKDRESRLLFANAALAQRLGAGAPIELVGVDDYSLFPKELAEAYRQDDRAVLQSGQPLVHKEEQSIDARTGDRQWFSTTKAPLFAADGTVNGLVGIAWDISDRRRAEEALRLALEETERRVEERTEDLTRLNRQLTEEMAEREKADEALAEERTLLRTLIDALPDSVYVADRQGRFVLSNPAHARIAGAGSPAEVLGRTVADVEPPEQAERTRLSDEAVLSFGQPLSNLEQMTTDRSTGRDFWQLASKIPLRDAHGRLTGLVSIGRDIDRLKRLELALRRAEQEKENLLDNLLVHVRLVDRDLRFVWVNRAAQLFIGLPNDVLAGRYCYDVQRGRKTPCPDCVVIKAMETGRVHETEIQAVDGRTYFLRGIPYYDLNGAITGALEVSLDITDRVRAEQALREERDFVHNIFETAPVVVLVLDVDGRVLRYNPLLARITGFSLEEIQGRDWFDTFIPERERSRVRMMFKQTLQAGGQTGNVNPILTRDGQERFIEWSDRLLTDGDGNTIGLLGIGQDVTERRQAQRALAESQDRLAQLFRMTPIPLFVNRVQDSTIVEANRAAERFSGYNREELLGHTAVELGIIREDDRLAIRRMADPQPPFWSHEMPVYTRDGRRRVGILTGEHAVIDGHLCMVQVLDDITERQAVQDQLARRVQVEALVASISSRFVNVPSAEVDGEIEVALEMLGQFIDVDRSYLMLFADLPTAQQPEPPAANVPIVVERMYEWCAEGVHPFKDIVVGRPLHAYHWSMNMLRRGETLIVPVVDNLPAEAVGERVVWSGDGLRSVIGIPLMKDGRLRATLGLDLLHEYRSWAISDVHVLRVVGETFLNVLARRQAEKEIVDAERLAALGRLMASLAHEINNPLQSMQYNLDLILDFPVEEAQRQEFLQVIRQELERLKGITGGVLDHARRVPTQTTASDVADVVERVLVLVRKELQHRNIKVDFERATLPPVAITADRLHQVCLNLVLNAVEALEGRPDATLSIDASATADSVILTFANNGPPIPEEFLGRLCEPFFTTKPDGSGLGLWTCYTLLGNDGTLTARNLEPNVGVAFTVNLRLHQPKIH